MTTATYPNQFIHVTGVSIQTLDDGLVPMVLAFDSFSLYIFKAEALKELTDETFVKFVQEVIDGKELKKVYKPMTLVIDTDPGTEAELETLINRKNIQLLCDPDWNEVLLKEVMPSFEALLGKKR